MKRRFFLKKSALASASALVFPHVLQSCKEEDEDIGLGKKVIVIGAGISGLAAARLLKSKKFDVVLLEARNTVGGRIQSQNFDGVTFDMGASWIHGPNGNPITKLADQAGITTFFTNDEKSKLYSANAIEWSQSEMDQLDAEYEKAMNLVKTATEGVSVESSFNQKFPGKITEDKWKYLLSAYLEFDVGADISEISAKHYDNDELFAGEDVIVVNGYKKIIHYLATDITIYTNEIVTEIDYSANKPVVKSNKNQYEADFVLVSVPLGVLKKQTINFIPPLSNEKKAAIQRLGFGKLAKYILFFDSVFWDSDTHYLGSITPDKGKFNYFLNMQPILNKPMLMTFAFGNTCSELVGKTEEELKDAIFIRLQQMFGIAKAKKPIHIFSANWETENHIWGSYTFPAVNCDETEYETIASNIRNKIFFAGEHTIQEYRGTVHGAYLSGIREAEKIIEAIK